MKLFLDANVLFTAAHNPDGKAALVVELARAGHWKTVTSPLAIEEAQRNLELKFPACVDRFDELVHIVDVTPDIFEGDCPIDLPEKDRAIFLSASGATCTRLLTGDPKHFGPFKNRPRRTRGMMIQTVGRFLEAI